MSFAVFVCSTGVTQNVAPTGSPTPASAATAAPSASPTRETLASAAAGYLDAPAKSKFGYSQVHVDGPYIAMTFDDGPSPANTPKLLDLLKKKGLKATFFVIGENAAQYPDIMKRIVAEGHEIADHSWSHPDFSKMSDEAVRSQIEKTQKAILDSTGMKATLLRPPYGSITSRQRQWLHDDFGFKIILWDVDPLDWKYRNSGRVGQEIVKNTVNGSIILAHDIHPTTVAAMPQTFDELLAKGFKFVTVSELLAMEKPMPPKPAADTHAAAGKKSAKPQVTGTGVSAPAATTAPH